ncbi:ABC-type multidrug transport system ATPase subunit [Haloferula luteola]|uniref:ABC-type multidrug transport system ATPase subunit n=1 Tax=Haloferula luteola TaxID=595692 RepID=A0A840VED9_9BACT|nr:ABC-type multidrug transport system ATPase subunit [Haloferula luteola]
MEIELKQVVKRFSRTLALDGIDLRLGPGVVSVIGLNGAGKTTLLNCLAGLLKPSSGTITFDGRPFSKEDLALARRIAWMPDFPLAFQNQTILEHIALWVRCYGGERPGLEDRVLEVLEALGIWEIAEHPMGELSRGQHYKAALAAQVVVEPELWVLDEPFASGMDPRGLQAFRNWAEERVASGGTVVFSTQILEMAEGFCDRLVVLEDGKLAYDLSREELAAMPVRGSGSLRERWLEAGEASP